MKKPFEPQQNYEKSRKRVGYTPRRETKPQAYAKLGFKCGLEVHQQLKTDKKLFCNCPAGRYHDFSEYDAEIVRHMRPTLSELGEYDGTVLMEFKTRKIVIYRIKNETTCTYEIDDTPPFLVNRQALEIAMEVALLLKSNIVGEFHITRKQYLDGSIPTGFQRTGILGIEGEIPLSRKKVRIIQLSVEEDACREISDIGHTRIYCTDRLGMPLIETVTYPEMLTPDEAAEAAHYIRFLARSTGKVRTGIGAAREDVNVSITGGTRVEIKGVAHIAWIPELVHNEAFRQKALLEIRAELLRRLGDGKDWRITSKEVDADALGCDFPPIRDAQKKKLRLLAVNLPGFAGLLSFFTQPGKMFADEIGDRLKVIACLEKPNMVHCEQPDKTLGEDACKWLRKTFKAGEGDAQLLFWAAADDVKTALETIEERCRLAFQGVPNETRKGLPDGRTIFERVLPGPDRMYPDTDSAPVPVEDDLIERVRSGLPPEIHYRLGQFRAWGVPVDTFAFLLKYNLAPWLEKISAAFGFEARFVAGILGHGLKNLIGRQRECADFNFQRLYDLFGFVNEQRLDKEIIKAMLPVLFQHPNMDFESVLTTVNFKRLGREEILAPLSLLKEKFKKIGTSKDPAAAARWIVGNLRQLALGNMPMREVTAQLAKGEKIMIDLFKGYKGPALELLKKFNIRVWSDTAIKTTRGDFKGIVLPRSENDDDTHIVLKLITGYNVGIAVESVLDIQEFGYKEAHYKIPEKQFPFSKDKKNVKLLGTGGTIASRLDYRTGAVIPAFSPGELYGAVPELADICNLTTEKLFAVFSENMGPEQYKGLAKAIGEEIRKGTNGIVIGHGTDTMHHTAGILSFMVQNSPVPIVMVGSQRSSDRPSSDAALNLMHATKTAADSDIAEIMVCMFGPTSDEYALLHRGTRVRKMHSSYRSTFRTIGDIPLAMVDRKKITPLRQDYKRRRNDRNVDILPFFEEKVGMLYYYPNMQPDMIDSMVDHGYRGIVIAGTGLGHVNKPLYPAIVRAAEKGVAMYMTVQTLWGYVHMFVYDTGRDLMAKGIIPAANMLPEVAYVKLAWALGQTEDLGKVKDLMLTPIAGEITEREPYNGYLIFQGGIPEVEEFIKKFHK